MQMPTRAYIKTVYPNIHRRNNIDRQKHIQISNHHITFVTLLFKDLNKIRFHFDEHETKLLTIVLYLFLSKLNRKLSFIKRIIMKTLCDYNFGVL